MGPIPTSWVQALTVGFNSQLSFLFFFGLNRGSILSELILLFFMFMTCFGSAFVTYQILAISISFNTQYPHNTPSLLRLVFSEETLVQILAMGLLLINRRKYFKGATSRRIVESGMTLYLSYSEHLSGRTTTNEGQISRNLYELNFCFASSCYKSTHWSFPKAKL